MYCVPGLSDDLPRACRHRQTRELRFRLPIAVTIRLGQVCGAAALAFAKPTVQIAAVVQHAPVADFDEARAVSFHAHPRQRRDRQARIGGRGTGFEISRRLHRILHLLQHASMRCWLDGESLSAACQTQESESRTQDFLRFGLDR